MFSRRASHFLGARVKRSNSTSCGSQHVEIRIPGVQHHVENVILPWKGTISLQRPNYKRMQLTAGTQSCGTRLCLLFRRVWQDTNNDNKYSTNVKKNNCNNSRPTTTWQSDWMSNDCLQATAAASPAPRPAFLTTAAPPVVAAIIPSKYQCCISIAAQMSATAAFQVRKQSCKLSSRLSIGTLPLLSLVRAHLDPGCQRD